MRLEKTTKVCNIIFIIIGVLTILEFSFVRGMFTGPLMMGLAALFGLINVVLELANKKYLTAVHFLITAIALCMGYAVLM